MGLNLQEEYNGSIKDCKDDDDNCPSEKQKEKLLEIDVAGLLYQMKKSDV